MKTIYLAGKVNGRKDKVVPSHPLVKYVSSDGSNHSEHSWAITGWRLFSDPALAEAVQKRCTEIIEKSDALFAYLDSPFSYGSIAEIAYASALEKQCFVVLRHPAGKLLEDDWSNGTMGDAYWFVANFPGVHATEVATEAEATALFARWLGFVLSESPAETLAWRGFLGCTPKSAPVSLPVPQYEINGYRIDFAWPDEKVAVEIDGHDYHKTKEQRSRDAKRDRDLLALGWTTLRFTGSDVYRDQDKVAKEAIAILTRQANGKQLKTQA